MKKTLFFIFMISFLVFAGCTTQNIEDVKTSENVGEKVSVKGTVQTTIKIGSLSGYTLSDDTGSIAVASESLPAEGDEIRVSGTLIRDSLLGYYIKVEE